MKNRYILKNSSRFVMCIVFVLVFSFSVLHAVTAYSSKAASYVSVQVKKGDTLWSIAKKYTGDGDIRECIYRIKQANNLEGSDVFQGTVLRIPLR